MTAPLVSVLMPVAEEMSFPYLEEAISSVLAQTFEDFELVVYRDGPGAKVDALMARVCAADPRVVYVEGAARLGNAAALNRCSRESRGDYIAIHDADDLSAPERFEKQLAALQARPECGMCFCWCSAIGEGGSIKLSGWHVRIRRVPFEHLSMMLLPEQRGLNFIANGTLLMRREVSLLVGERDARMVRLSDYAFYLRALKLGLFATGVQEVLYYHRQHACSLTHRAVVTQEDAAAIWDGIVRG